MLSIPCVVRAAVAGTPQYGHVRAPSGARLTRTLAPPEPPEDFEVFAPEILLAMRGA